ncbi:MAG: sulfotransferase domain-containing protein [Gammaproteobacteria bacterium]|nr:sulfotransferase domain-containing protein [Gammaproteobacteria bacterium]
MSVPGPDFFIIGAQKCGTSWLHQQLRRHENVYMPADKDPPLHLLDQTDCQRLKDRQNSGDEDQLRGDCNAAYLWTTSSMQVDEDLTETPPHHFNPDIVELFHACMGSNMKIIVLLRDPVQRAVSAYLHHIAMRSLQASTPIFQSPADLGIISMGFYSVHLNNWLQKYSPERILLLPSPEQNNADQLLTETSRFLQITPFSHISKTVVFPGLRRHKDEHGVWVNLEHAAFQQQYIPASIPCKLISGVNHALLISCMDLQRLHVIYREELNRLHDLTSKIWPAVSLPFLAIGAR